MIPRPTNSLSSPGLPRSARKQSPAPFWSDDGLPELKGLVDLPREQVYYAMLFGCPAVRYARTVERKGDATIRRVDALATAG
jgi:hypothetical protein